MVEHLCLRILSSPITKERIRISKQGVVSLEELPARSTDHELKKFADEVESSSLEKPAMFSCLLKDHRVSEEMTQLNKEIQTLYEVFMWLK